MKGEAKYDEMVGWCVRWKTGMYSVMPDEATARLCAAAGGLLEAGQRCLMALDANGAPNCEAAKEMRAQIAAARGK